jgi:hypothetical protein
VWNARCSKHGSHVELRLLVVVLIVRASVDQFEREALSGSPAIVQLAVILFFHAHRAGWRERARTGRRRG